MLRFLILLSLLTPLALQPGAAAAAGPVQRLALAVSLYDQASRLGDGMQMAVAARLAAAVRIRKASHWQFSSKAQEARSTDAGAKPDAPDAPAAEAAVTLDLLLSDAAWAGALVMAEEDESLSDLLAELPAPAITGSASRADAVLAAAMQDQWRLPLDGQSPAEIAVFATASAARAPLWRVEDDYGTVICPAQRAGWSVCRFTPGANGYYRVLIEDAPIGGAGYSLVTN